jgi:hypothetical protein
MLIAACSIIGCASLGDDFAWGWTSYVSSGDRATVITPDGEMYYLTNPETGRSDPSTMYGHDEGGDTSDCSSSRWICLDGPGLFVIPADDSLESWTYEDISCERLADRRIACRRARGVITIFEFDRTRGVLAFSVDGHPEQRFYRGTPLLAPDS